MFSFLLFILFIQTINKQVDEIDYSNLSRNNKAKLKFNQLPRSKVFVRDDADSSNMYPNDLLFEIRQKGS